jgi:hypothetical protein
VRLARAARVAAAELPGVLRVLWLMRTTTDLERLLEAVGRVRVRPAALDDARRERVQRGVSLALALLGRARRPCVPRSLAVYARLREAGLEPVFVSGVRRDERGDIDGHAWLELGGRPVPGFGDEAAPAAFRENFRFPRPDGPRP